MWSHSGRELFYIDDANQLIAAAVQTQPVFSVGAQKALFTLPLGVRPNALAARYAVSRDDQRFLMIRSAGPARGDSARETVVLVTNFVEELKAKLGAPR